MKQCKILALLLLAVLTLALSGCANEPDPPAEAATVRIAAMRGPTALGLLRLMYEQDQGTTQNNYEFTLLGSPDEVPPLLVRGEVDIAAVPGNLAAILFNAGAVDIQALAVVTLGVLHVIDMTGEINTIQDLAGRTIHVSPQGATPEFALNYVLNMNGLTPGVDVNIEFRAEHTELAALMETGQADIALLPEPFASTVVARIPEAEFALDLTEEWNRVQSDYGLVMSVVVARREFLENNPEAVSILLSEYANSIAFVQNNVPEAAQLAVDFEIIGALPIAQAALPRTHVVFLNGDEMKRNLMGFYSVLYNENPASVGGSLPEEGFFFVP